MNKITTVGISIQGLTVATTTVVEITVSAPCKIRKVANELNFLFYQVERKFKKSPPLFLSKFSVKLLNKINNSRE